MAKIKESGLSQNNIRSRIKSYNLAGFIWVTLCILILLIYNIFQKQKYNAFDCILFGIIGSLISIIIAILFSVLNTFFWGYMGKEEENDKIKNALGIRNGDWMSDLSAYIFFFLFSPFCFTMLLNHIEFINVWSWELIIINEKTSEIVKGKYWGDYHLIFTSFSIFLLFQFIIGPILFNVFAYIFVYFRQKKVSRY